MGSLSTPLPPPYFPPPSPTRPRNPRLQTSSLLSPWPRTKRTNHLRRKLTKTLIPKPHDPSPPPPDPADDAVLFLEETTVVEEVVHESEGVDPFPPVAHSWFSRPIVDLSLRFAALLAVQAVAAVWFLGGGAVEERTDGGVRTEGEKEVMIDVGDASEFERKVEEIRVMAKEARASEVKDAVKGNGVFVDDKAYPSHRPLSENKGGRSDSGKSNSRRKNGFLNSNAMGLKVPKGFKGSKNRDERINGGNGGIRQIAHQNPVKESAPMRELIIPETIEEFPDVADSTAPPMEDQLSVDKMHTPTQGTIGRLGNGLDPSTSEMGNSSSFLEEDTQSTLSFRESSSKNYTNSDNLSDASRVQNESMQLETQIEQSYTEENQKPATISRNIKGRSERGSQIKEIERRSIVDKEKDDQFDTGNKTWWLELPYVLVVFLHRGSDRSGQKGLYSLKMNSTEDDGISPSYTVAFQDRGDATNFCYILESFFEDLGDFSADIVPLTIRELDEAVNSGAWKVVVVRKGQLRLYAGQPLTEVETALRSFLD